MAEKITLFVMLVGAMGSSLLVTVRTKKEKRNMIPDWILSAFFVYWGCNATRSMLLIGNTIYPYSQDWYLCLLDIITIVGACFFITNWKKEQQKRCFLFEVVAGAAIVGYYIVTLCINLYKYHNFNASIYYSLQHNQTMLFGTILWTIFLLFYGFYDKPKGMNKKVSISVLSLCVVTIFLYPALETYIVNAKEFNFSIQHVWLCFLLYQLLAFGVMYLLALFFIKKNQYAFIRMIWCISITAYFQGLFLNGSMFLMDGKDLEWTTGRKVLNFLIWMTLIAVLHLLLFYLKKYRNQIMLYSSVLLCGMQLTGLLSLIPKYVGSENVGETEQNYLSEQGMFELADEENIIVFVLDTYDVRYIEKILEKNPDFFNPLKGFTYYPDMVSQFSRTFPSIPYMLTNETYYYEIPQKDYVNHAFETNTFWHDLEQKGFAYYIYEDAEDLIGETICENAGNFVEQGHTIREKVSMRGCFEAFTRMNLYRLFPYAFKNYYNYTAETISDLVISERIWDYPEYVMDDCAIYDKLKQEKLTVSEDKKAFRFIHLNGAHGPYVMDQDGTRIPKWKASMYLQSIGCMKLVFDYLDLLQKCGMFEKSTIIITADHGENYVTSELERNTNPILFIKPYGVGPEKELIYSDVMASQNDIIPTIAKLHGLACDENWGINLLEPNGEDLLRVRYHYYAVVEKTVQTKTRTYEISGNSLDFSNWIATDEYHQFGEYYPTSTE